MSRRARPGTGTVFPWRRKDPVTGELRTVGWEAVADLGKDANGQRQRRAIRGKDRSEVERRLAELLEGKRKGVVQPSRKLTVEDWLEKWLRSIKTEVRPRTLEHYKLHVERYLIPAIGHRPLANLVPSDVNAMLGQLRAKGLKPRTVAHAKAVLRNALHVGERDGLIMRNVARLSKAVKVPTTDIKVLDPEQVKVFQAAIAGDRLEALYLVTLGLGLRQGEALGLTWDAVDLDGGRLRVSQAPSTAVGPRPAPRCWWSPRARSQGAAWAWPGILVEALRRHRVRQSEERLAAGWHWHEEWNLVFCTERGEPLKPWRVLRDFKLILVQAGLPVIRFHDLRHSAASLLLLHGVDVRTVADILGHSSTHLTQNTYQHVLPQLREQAVRAQEAYLGG